MRPQPGPATGQELAPALTSAGPKRSQAVSPGTERALPASCPRPRWEQGQSSATAHLPHAALTAQPATLPEAPWGPRHPGQWGSGLQVLRWITSPCCHRDAFPVTEEDTASGWELVPNPAWHRGPWTRVYGYMRGTQLPGTQTAPCSLPGSAAPLGHCWDTAGTSLGHCWDIAAVQPHGPAQFEPAACGQDMASTGHCARDTEDSTHRAELWLVGAGHGCGLSKWPRTLRRL